MRTDEPAANFSKRRIVAYRFRHWYASLILLGLQVWFIRRGESGAGVRRTMQAVERLVSGRQRHWLIRKHVEQADVAAINKASRVKKP